MHTLVVLSDQPRWNDYYSILFPLYKWKSIIRKNNVRLIITLDKNDKRLKQADTAIIISRAFSDGWQSMAKRNSENEAELIDYLKDLKKNVKQLIWYDRSDSSGTTDFPIIEYVDLFLKNQVLKDLNYYSLQNGAKSIRQWLTDTGNLQEHFTKYFPCPVNQLHKIKTGWNITHSDQRIFNFKLNRITSNYLFSSPKTYQPSANRKLDFSIRGSLDYGNKNAISTQRNKVITLLKELTQYNSSISGVRISKPEFMQELAHSKICVSPFGWGEICYRDFEIFIAGALLVKPDINYLHTYPDIFIENETYIPVSWQMDDLQPKIEEILSNYPKYLEVARNGQNAFMNAITDGEAFVQHLKSIIN